MTILSSWSELLCLESFYIETELMIFFFYQSEICEYAETIASGALPRQIFLSAQDYTANVVSLEPILSYFQLNPLRIIWCKLNYINPGQERPLTSNYSRLPTSVYMQRVETVNQLEPWSSLGINNPQNNRDLNQVVL